MIWNTSHSCWYLLSSKSSYLRQIWRRNITLQEKLKQKSNRKHERYIEAEVSCAKCYVHKLRHDVDYHTSDIQTESTAWNIGCTSRSCVCQMRLRTGHVRIKQECRGTRGSSPRVPTQGCTIIPHASCVHKGRSPSDVLKQPEPGHSASR